MKEPEFGPNKTGIATAPELAKEMIEGQMEFPPTPLDTRIKAKVLRQAYIQESGPLGTVPYPSATNQVASNIEAVDPDAVQPIDPELAEVLIDKLSERLAFERSGTRLYSALIRKCETEMENADLSTLRRFRDEEKEHFEMIRDCLDEFGADSTAQTPCADATGVASMGLVQLLNDPRSDVPQCVQAILIAELTDNAGWEILIELAETAHLEQHVEKFRKAKEQEDEHLLFIQAWLRELILGPDIQPLAGTA